MQIFVYVPYPVGLKIQEDLNLPSHMEIWIGTGKVVIDQSHCIRRIPLGKLKCYQPSHVICVPKALKFTFYSLIKPILHICIPVEEICSSFWH